MADTKSKKTQAELNSREWLNKTYRPMAQKATPGVDPISMQSQMVAALRDPVYGQATATGLAAGEGMLNSWIAGINSRARKDEGELANERWIKQMQDADKDRELRRKELEESKKTPIESVDFEPMYFASKEDTDKYNQMIADPIFKAQVAADPIAEFKIREARKAKQRQIDELSKKVTRSVMPDVDTIDEKAVPVNESSNWKDRLSDQSGEFERWKQNIQGKKGIGRKSSGGIIDRLFLNSAFQNEIANKLYQLKGNRATRAFNNLAEYQNILSAAKHMEEARMVGNLIREQLKNGDSILELIAGEDKDSPLYIRTKTGAKIFDPLRPTELLPFTVE